MPNVLISLFMFFDKRVLYIASFMVFDNEYGIGRETEGERIRNNKREWERNSDADL